MVQLLTSTPVVSSGSVGSSVPIPVIIIRVDREVGSEAVEVAAIIKDTLAESSDGGNGRPGQKPAQRQTHHSVRQAPEDQREKEPNNIVGLLLALVFWCLPN